MAETTRGMTKAYREKPQIVQAGRWNPAMGCERDAYRPFGGEISVFRSCPHCSNPGAPHLVVTYVKVQRGEEFHGFALLCPGDWAVKHADGVVSGVRNSYFAKAFEEIETETDPAPQPAPQPAGDPAPDYSFGGVDRPNPFAR